MRWRQHRGCSCLGSSSSQAGEGAGGLRASLSPTPGMRHSRNHGRNGITHGETCSRDGSKGTTTGGFCSRTCCERHQPLLLGPQQITGDSFASRSAPSSAAKRAVAGFPASASLRLLTRPGTPGRGDMLPPSPAGAHPAPPRPSPARALTPLPGRGIVPPTQLRGCGEQEEPGWIRIPKGVCRGAGGTSCISSPGHIHAADGRERSQGSIHAQPHRRILPSSWFRTPAGGETPTLAERGPDWSPGSSEGLLRAPTRLSVPRQGRHQAPKASGYPGPGMWRRWDCGGAHTGSSRNAAGPTQLLLLFHGLRWHLWMFLAVSLPRWGSRRDWQRSARAVTGGSR